MLLFRQASVGDLAPDEPVGNDGGLRSLHSFRLVALAAWVRTLSPSFKRYMPWPSTSQMTYGPVYCGLSLSPLRVSHLRLYLSTCHRFCKSAAHASDCTGSFAFSVQLRCSPARSSAVTAVMYTLAVCSLVWLSGTQNMP